VRIIFYGDALLDTFSEPTDVIPLYNLTNSLEFVPLIEMDVGQNIHFILSTGISDNHLE
jgi:hypothetical protein